MKKYLAIFAALLLISVFVTAKNANDAKYADTQSTPVNKAASVTATNKVDPQKDNSGVAKRHSPSWDVFSAIFSWPNGLGAWVVFLTLVAIVEQTQQTSRAALATEAAVITANKTFALQEDTAKRQLRAYMVLRKGKILVLDNGQLRLSIEMENSGQTPAYDFQGVIRCEFADYPRVESWEPIKVDLRSKGIIGSGRIFHAGGDSPHIQTKVEELRGNSNRCLFVTGYFTYLDIFRDPHHLRLQLIFGGPMGIRLDTDESGKDFYFAFTDVEGNEAD